MGGEGRGVLIEHTERCEAGWYSGGGELHCIHWGICTGWSAAAWSPGWSSVSELSALVHPTLAGYQVVCEWGGWRLH